MDKMNEDTILHFYRILENSLLESDISKINEEDIDAWSQSFKKVVREIQEDAKHDLDWLKVTIYYQSVDEEAQECIDDSYEDSPNDNGKDNAADYELLECTY